MPDLSSLPDPLEPPTTTPSATVVQGATQASEPDPIDAIGADPFAAPDTEPEADPFAAPDAVSDATVAVPPAAGAQGATTVIPPAAGTTAAGSYPAEQPDYSAPQPIPSQAAQPLYQPRQFSSDAYELPDNLRPLGAWSYVGHAILYAIPVVGLIFLIVHSVSKKNINRRNYARSFWIWILFSAIILAVLTLAGVIAASTWEEPVRRVQSAVSGLQA